MCCAFVIEKLAPRRGGSRVTDDMDRQLLFRTLSIIAALLLGAGLPAAASDTSARPNPADQRVLITAVKFHGKEITLTFMATGEVRTYQVDELSMLADGKGPLEVSELSLIHI